MTSLDLETIQKKHQEMLRQSSETSDVDIDILQVQGFLGTLAQAGANIEDVEQRSFLRSLIRYWASIVYYKTGTFPTTQLQPFSQPKSQSIPIGSFESSSALTNYDATRNNKRSFVRPVLVMLVILALIIVGLIFALAFYPRPELITGLVIILGLGVLLVLLFILAAGFSSLDIADKSQAMGLPEGSIRAIIALFLIVVWIVMSIYLFSSVGGPSSNSDAVKLAQQLFTTLSTLVVAVASFYFGSRSAASAHRALAPSTATSKPVIRKVDPTSYDLSQGAQELPFTIEGINFQSPKEVRLIQGSTVMDGTVTSTSETKIQYKITNLPNQKSGKWDLMIVNEDGGQGQLTEAFEVITSEASEVTSTATASPRSPIS